jgi:hypothetical protein
VCTNAAPRARDGDPRFAPVVLAGYTAADTPRPAVYPYCARHIREPIALLCSAPRGTRDEGDRTRRLCSGADVGSSTIGAELIHGFLKFPRHHLQSAQAPQHARTGFAAIPFATKSGVEPTTAGMLRLLGEELQLSAPPALPTPLRLPGRVHDQLM